MSNHSIVTSRAGVARSGKASNADPITTEVLRHALNSAANQMKRALIRTAFSPVIYEVLDFAVAIYDRDLRLLAQAPSLPMFMGTLSFCVDEAVKGVGGVDKLNDGDIIIYNWPFGTGSHAQDLAVVMPVFAGPGNLIGYTVIKGHWLDIGGKDPYCTDTVDVYQEGTFYPGVKIYKAGVRDDEIFRIIMANSRVAKMIAGDLNAEVVGVRIGARAFREVYERYAGDTFNDCVEAMFDHSEKIVRSYFEKIPDGRYVGKGKLDNSGVTPEQIPFDLTVEINGSEVTLDFTDAPPAVAGPMNSPLPGTISVSRVAISMLAGYGEAPNEGHFRPIVVKTKPGTLFHPLPPAPCFLYGWPGLQAIEVIYQAISNVAPEKTPASSGGCIYGAVWWGTREQTGEPWADGSPHPCGQGAWHDGDGGTMLHISESATRFSPVEVWETRNPWLFDKVELSVDSCGPGEYRGGPGVDFHFRMTEPCYVTTVVERTTNAPWGIEGGGSGRANMAGVRYPDGAYVSRPKETRIAMPKDGVLELRTGGGGGYGDPSKRSVDAVKADLRAGYITEEFARKHYPHAV